jgi:hypothetical protein
MRLAHKIVAIMASQIVKPNVKLPLNSDKPHKIQDDNQSVKFGVINEKSDASLRSASPTGKKRGRKPKSERSS